MILFHFLQDIIYTSSIFWAKKKKKCFLLHCGRYNYKYVYFWNIYYQILILGKQYNSQRIYERKITGVCFIININFDNILVCTTIYCRLS